MSTSTRRLGGLLLVTLLFTPPVAMSAQSVGDLDVTIRMIDRHNPDVEALINRIELPRVTLPGEAGQTTGQGRRDGAGRPASERSRDTIRERIERGGGEDRRRQGSEARDTAHDAVDRGREARQNAMQLRDERRDDLPGGGPPFRD